MSYTTIAIIILFFAIVYFSLFNNSLYFEHRVIVTDVIDDEYDYVIVGGGTAGSVIAARLAEDKANRVLLLEAGGFYDDWMLHILMLWPRMQTRQYDWKYYTEPQKYSHFGFEGNRAYWPRGRVLGGSGMINSAQYTRGSRYDFDEWAANGCEGWSYKEVLPYFLKAEDIQVEELKTSKYHNIGGPMAVSESSVTQLADLYLKAGQDLGYNITDYNGAEQLGFSKVQLNARKGKRESSAVAYLGRPVKKDNLDIAIHSFVTKISFKGKTATGVYYIRNNRKYFVRARNEVILSAGSVNSPQLLLLSGIGPKEHLKEMNIPLIADLPVGDNLQDHQILLLHSKINKSIGLTPALIRSFWTFIQYKISGSGPFSSAGAEASAFVNVDNKSQDKMSTGLQMIMLSVVIPFNKLKLKYEIKKDFEAWDENVDGFMVGLINTHPKSRGTLRLRSNDPFEHPILDPRYLQEQEDVEDLIAGIRIWEKYIETPTMKELGCNIDDMRKSFCSQHEFRSDSYWECMIRYMSVSSHHISCTCKMGALDDPSAVLDPFLRVKGIKGLRVVDASAFPNVTTGNTNAPTVMLAEKAADIIRGIDSVKRLRHKLPDNVSLQ